jgi:hypothetical protein
MHTQLSTVVVNPELQPRTEGLDTAHVKALEEGVVDWPPLVVVDRSGVLVLIDGFHRMAAAQNLGLTEVLVEVADMPTDGDLRGLAFAFNAVHGRPLTLTDRRTEAARLLRLAPQTSDREIGRRCGLSQPTIAKVRSALESGAQIEHLDHRVGADSRTYPANVTSRQPGELSPQGAFESVGQFFSSTERRGQRRIASFLQRVVVAMEDGVDLLDDPQTAGSAVRQLLGDEEAAQLGERIMVSAVALTDVAETLVPAEG